MALRTARGRGSADVAARVHPGLLRGTNEDVACADVRLGLAIVADGLGGHDHGHIASRVAVDTLVRAFRRRGGAAATRATTAARLVRAIEEADLEVRAQPATITRAPMGTTLVALAFGDAWVAVAHAGDSRCYRVRGARVARLTRDHTTSDTDDASTPFAPGGRLLTGCLGGGVALRVDVATDEAIPGDVYVLCSDGVWEAISDVAIARIVSGSENASAACDRFVEAACGAGGHDNIGVAIVRIGPRSTGVQRRPIML